MKMHESAGKYRRTRLLKWLRINVIYVVGRECISEMEFLISIYSIMRPTPRPTPFRSTPQHIFPAQAICGCIITRINERIRVQN